MKDRDPAIRLRAINAYLDLDGKQGCPTCAHYAQNSLNIERIVQYATDEQANEMRAHIGVIKAHVVSIKAIKAKVLDYIAAGGTPHEEEIIMGQNSNTINRPGPAPQFPSRPPSNFPPPRPVR